ncbi:hypothetical protein OGT34_004014 [Salmonella enterica]|nr:hypothetical protein [Salmonella enterica]
MTRKLADGLHWLACFNGGVTLQGQSISSHEHSRKLSLNENLNIVLRHLTVVLIEAKRIALFAER